jgi:hypothetical protein
MLQKRDLVMFLDCNLIHGQTLQYVSSGDSEIYAMEVRGMTNVAGSQMAKVFSKPFTLCSVHPFLVEIYGQLQVSHHIPLNCNPPYIADANKVII